MSIIIGPFSPTATNAQFNDQLYLQSGAYIIHNPTSYQLNFIKADSHRFIVDPGTVRTVHKVGGNAGNVTWTASLVGPLAILNTPGFTIEILQQGVDDIPPESIVGLSQIATQQPRIQTVPYSSFQNNHSSQSMSTGQGDLTTIIASFPYSATTAGSAGFWLYWLLITGINGSAAAGELWSLTSTMRVVTLTAGQAVVQSADIFFAQLNAVGPILTPIALSFPNPIARYFTAGAGEVTLALQTVMHISLLAAARAVSISYAFGFDNDVMNNNPPPGPGGGLETFSGQVIGSQYTGIVW